MKNIFRTLTIVAAAGALTFSVSACGDKFLNEVQRTKLDATYLDAPDVLYSMSQSLYLQFRQMFYAESWAYTNAGTDEFMIGGDGASEAYNTYDTRYGAKVEGSANTMSAHFLWEMMYSWINRANKIIDRAEDLEGYAKRDEALGTAYFIRGYDYMFLVNQYGDIPLVLHTSDLPEREFSREPRKDVYDQILSDLGNAYKLLPDKGDLDGKIDKSTAAHFLAQAHLWRASECNADWNSSFKAQDLEEVIKYAKIVIAAHPLVARYEDLYANYTKNGACSPEINSEIVLKASHDVGTSERGTAYTGNMTLCWFVMPYQNAFSKFMARDVSGGRSYQRLKNTPRYCYFLYDLKNDSRFWKSFKTTWAINQLPTKENDMTYIAKDGSKIYTPDYFGKHNTEATFSKYLGGMFIFNRKEYGQKFLTEDIDISYNARNEKRFRVIDYNTGKYIPTTKALYTYGSLSDAEPENTSMNPVKDGQFAMLSKYLDGDVDRYNLDKGFRDAVIARSAEDYFFWAEALIRQGKINEGLAVLKPLRDRAQFRAGEERDKYMDGGQAFATSSYRSSITAYTNRSTFYPKNSYFYSVGGWDKDQAYRDAVNAEASVLQTVTDGNYPPEDEYVMNFLAEVNPKYKSDAFTRAMCYLLDEKSREMYGEFLRYNDLVRTRTLEDRLRFNDQAWTQDMTDILGHTGNQGTAGGDIEKYYSPNGGNFNKAQHYLRPIPLEHLNRITKDGHALTSEEINEIQNPGY
ncbi:MAG: RagB/SusD family nutrient uptake outer membrane protein [Bacteroidales bacterium]|nr:RagB/SusD family nutrient uptake outer membrane protein [Bacteroidales bacterium]